MSGMVLAACLVAIIVLVAGIIKTWLEVTKGGKPWDGRK